MRRCRSCWHTAQFPLPTIRKAVVYIDQFALSNMLKVRDETTKGHERASENPFWQELWDALAKLRRYQLICCPDSEEHENESLLGPYFKKLKGVYERLSGGVTFNGFEHIRHAQVFELARAWAGQRQPVYDFDAESMTYGGIHQWNDRIFVTTGSMKLDQVEVIRQAREAAHDGLKKVFERWKSEKKTYDEVYEIERTGYMEGIRETFRSVLEKRYQIQFGKFDLDINAVLPCEGELLQNNVAEAIRGERGSEHVQKLSVEFFKQNVLKDAPFIKISATLYAVLAAKAAAGQKEPPNKGTISDISFISALLPYCDAMSLITSLGPSSMMCPRRMR
jgi:hypothetical protein